MDIVCSNCGADLANDPDVCPDCSGTAKGYRFGREDIKDGRIQAPEGFFALRDELPDWYRWSGWLWEDEDHPRGTGAPAYRVVYKTIRVPIIGRLNLIWPNLTVRMWHGSVRVGRSMVNPSHKWRKDGHAVVPEWGTVSDTPTGVEYAVVRASSPTLGADEEEYTDGSFIEFVLQITPGKPNEQIAEGRRKLASLMTVIDLSFGRRLLGVPLTEEIGEVFEDGHFNCWPQSSLIGLESLTTVRPVSAQHELKAWAESVIGRHMERPESERVRLNLAAEWYRLAESTIDPVLEFIYMWLSIEVLAMPNTSNIRPLRERLAEGLGGSEQDWRQLVGRLYGTRSNIVHGAQRSVDPHELENLRDIVEALFELELGWIARDRRSRLLGATRAAT
jgi:hypothetical protein